MPISTSINLKQKGFAHIFFILILLAGIGVAVYLTQFTQVFKPKAYNPQISQYPVTIGMNYNHTSYSACNVTAEGSPEGMKPQTPPLSTLITAQPPTCAVEEGKTCRFVCPTEAEPNKACNPEFPKIQLNAPGQSNLRVKVKGPDGTVQSITDSAQPNDSFDVSYLQRGTYTFELYSGGSLIGSALMKGVPSVTPGSDDKGLLLTYGKPGVRDEVKRQLATMRASGIQTIGVMIYHLHDAGALRPDGLMPSETGKVSEPYRTNMINYFNDVRDAGFEKMQITMAPQWWNNASNIDNEPVQYNPTYFEENWQYLQDVRSIVKQHGTPESYFDLLGEGEPPVVPNPPTDPVARSKYDKRNAQLTEYDKQIWARYVSTYGKDDAVISFTYDPFDKNGKLDQAGNAAFRLRNLYQVFKSSGAGQPKWYSFSYYPLGGQAGALALLNGIDAELNSLAQSENDPSLLTTPLRIREGWYDNAEAAQAIRDFNNTHSRKVVEVLSWPLNYVHAYAPYCFVSPPYNQTAFVSNLPQTNGQISATPATCQIEPGKDTCTAKITWTTANTLGKVQVKVRETGVVFAEGSTGANDATWVSKSPVHLDLYDGTHFLNSLIVQGTTKKSATINANPNPCILETNGLCSSNITVNNPDGLTKLQIKVREGNNVPFTGVLPNPEGKAIWITKNGYNFDLYSNDKLVDSVFVKGEVAAPSAPNTSRVQTTNVVPSSTPQPLARITASPTICKLGTNGLCSSDIKVTNPTGLKKLQIKVREGNVAFTGVLANPEGRATWITKKGYNFDLYSDGKLIDSVFVKGQP